jgi:hypothetical protein
MSARKLGGRKRRLEAFLPAGAYSKFAPKCSNSHATFPGTYPLERAKPDTFAIGLSSARQLMVAAPLREMERRTILPFTKHQVVID